ncbi:conserved hypothetical protein [Perkinsus marinus ATCC 50983]|uniref:Senescence domain-containing protein n=1 Tax=Perkinsus marinus (strain ATCC 50983 / TXsc) TaxID=423536 RepID=C5KN31_PERM5|nr:conserved hypothetical protein [Perkinsus marinus ATCC 50983]EER14065.1 conserved hypothetical protein [Perkinsus marinus ATCC 50983]|eukprot:XP_002782270.1 conserved hypothetical protein [Perkinsus marinus ATCC 50983]
MKEEGNGSPPPREETSTTTTMKEEGNGSPPSREETSTTTTMKEEGNGSPPSREETSTTTTMKEEDNGSPPSREETSTTTTMKEESNGSPPSRGETSITTTMKEESNGSPPPRGETSTTMKEEGNRRDDDGDTHGKSATAKVSSPHEDDEEACESSNEDMTTSDEDWPSPDDIAAGILDNSDWAAQCIQSGAGRLEEFMRGFTDYTFPEDSAVVEEPSSSEDNEDAKAVIEGLKTATGAIASAANSAVGTVGGYIVRAGSSALQGLREEMKDDDNFTAADKVGSAAVTGLAKVLSGLSSAKSDLEGVAADEVSKAAARRYGKDAGIMVRDSLATAGNATSLLSVATPSNVISKGMQQASPSTVATASVQDADLLGLSEDEQTVEPAVDQKSLPEVPMAEKTLESTSEGLKMIEDSRSVAEKESTGETSESVSGVCEDAIGSNASTEAPATGREEDAVLPL